MTSYQKAYYQKNREKLLAQMKAYQNRKKLPSYKITSFEIVSGLVVAVFLLFNLLT